MENKIEIEIKAKEMIADAVARYEYIQGLGNKQQEQEYMSTSLIYDPVSNQFELSVRSVYTHNGISYAYDEEGKDEAMKMLTAIGIELQNTNASITGYKPSKEKQ